MSTPNEEKPDTTAGLATPVLPKLPEPPATSGPAADAFAVLKGPAEPAEPSLKDATAPKPVPAAPIATPIPVKVAVVEPPKAIVPTAPVKSGPAVDSFTCLGGSPKSDKKPVEPPKSAEPSLKDATAPKPVPAAPIATPIPVKVAVVEPPKAIVPTAPPVAPTEPASITKDFSDNDEAVATPKLTRDNRATPTVRGGSPARVIINDTPPPKAVPAAIEEPRKKTPLYNGPRPAAGARPEAPKNLAKHADFEDIYGGGLESTPPPSKPMSETAQTVAQKPVRSSAQASTANPAKRVAQVIFTALFGIFLLTVGFVIRDGNVLVLTPNAPAEASSTPASNPPNTPKKYRLVAVTEETLKDVAKAHPGSGGTVKAWHWASNDWHDPKNGFKDWPVDPNKVGLNCDGVKGFRYRHVNGFDTFDATNCKVSYPVP